MERKADIRVDGGQVYAPAISTYPFAGQTIGTPSVRSTLQDDIALSVLSFPEDADDAVAPCDGPTIDSLVVDRWHRDGGGHSPCGRARPTSKSDRPDLGPDPRTRLRRGAVVTAIAATGPNRTAVWIVSGRVAFAS